MTTIYKLEIYTQKNKLEYVKNIYKDCETSFTDLTNFLIYKLLNSKNHKIIFPDKNIRIVKIDNKLKPLINFINSKQALSKEEQKYWSNKLDTITDDYQKYQQEITNNNTKITKQYVQIFNNDLKQIEPKLKELNILNLSNFIMSLIDQTTTNIKKLVELSSHKGMPVSSNLKNTIATYFSIPYNSKNIKEFQKWYKDTIKE